MFAGISILCEHRGGDRKKERGKIPAAAHIIDCQLKRVYGVYGVYTVHKIIVSRASSQLLDSIRFVRSNYNCIGVDSPFFLSLHCL